MIKSIFFLLGLGVCVIGLSATELGTFLLGTVVLLLTYRMEN